MISDRRGFLAALFVTPFLARLKPRGRVKYPRLQQFVITADYPEPKVSR